ncbi:CNGC5-like protein, partial [Trifolium medium]|nr:CNGC5-like protein [Trifolium medium]
MERLRNKSDASSIVRFTEIQHQHAKTLIQEEAFWRQRAKMHWLKDGDLNTKFIHRSATARAKVKKIEKLRNDEEEVVTGLQNLEEIIRKYFKILFQPKGGNQDLEQSTFVEGRSIIYNALIAIEIIHTLKRRTRGGKGELALKIDISKAYDKVEWSFLKGMLIKMGFSDTWVHWMMLSNLSETRKLMELLKIYEEASGQEINLSKSEVFFSRNIRRATQADLSNMMGVRQVMGAGTYLRLPSMVGRSKKETFAFVKYRIWKRINSWRSRPLSRA